MRAQIDLADKDAVYEVLTGTTGSARHIDERGHRCRRVVVRVGYRQPVAVEGSRRA